MDDEVIDALGFERTPDGRRDCVSFPRRVSDS